ncbi:MULTISPECIES: FadR/GntR family transcriptional regulator [unclassified Actinotalea]|uniref:FadR/GntR family transcriptional regulator n=1 Tax=unclassified Actinotalea TaxID=2638618 RepID=UPI0015F3970E|nr:MULTISPECIES: FadR/GntR family transcriptional regulator [unclassified Actinotalea]
MTRRTNLIDLAVGRLRQQITSGTWEVGSRIPAEPELTELIGVGRNTVREAVQSLVHAGMLERRQGSGTYVLSNSELGNAMGRQIAGAHQRDVLEVRRSLEVEAARLAALRRTDEQVAELRALRDSRREAFESGELDRMVEADLALHRTIAVASHNPVLLALYENLQDAIGENIRFNFEHPVHDDDSHHVLVEAVAAADPEAAMREIDRYLSELIGEELRPAETGGGSPEGLFAPGERLNAPDAERPA